MTAARTLARGFLFLTGARSMKHHAIITAFFMPGVMAPHALYVLRRANRGDLAVAVRVRNFVAQDLPAYGRPVSPADPCIPGLVGILAKVASLGHELRSNSGENLIDKAKSFASALAFVMESP